MALSPTTVSPPEIFKSRLKMRFRNADPAGIMFFGNILGISHDVFEDFIQSLELDWNEWFKSEQYGCPIRHTEVDYLAPLFPGQEYTVEVKVSKISGSSFNTHYEFKNQNNKLCARVQMVHVFIDPKTMKKIPFPEKFRLKLEKYCLPDANEFNFKTAP